MMLECNLKLVCQDLQTPAKALVNLSTAKHCGVAKVLHMCTYTVDIEKT